MPTASRILSDEMGSTACAILAVHVIAGLTAVITGAVAAPARRAAPAHPGRTLVLPGHHRRFATALAGMR